MTWSRVAPSSDIAVGDMKKFTVQELEVTVYHLEDGWYASADMCTHQDYSLSEGEMDGDEIVCWCHGGAFDIRTGQATRLPCVVPLEMFPTRIVDGWIEVDVE